MREVQAALREGEAIIAYLEVSRESTNKHFMGSMTYYPTCMECQGERHVSTSWAGGLGNQVLEELLETGHVQRELAI